MRAKAINRRVPALDSPELAAREAKLERAYRLVLEQAASAAADRFERAATDHDALVAAPGVTSTTAMVAVYPTDEQAARLAQPNGELPERLHVTLAFLEELDPDQAEAVAGIVANVAADYGALAGEVGGVASFGDNGNGHPSILLPDVHGLAELRHGVCSALKDAGIPFAQNHGWTPHLTVDYAEEPTPPPPHLIGCSLDFAALSFTRGDVRRDFSFGRDSVVAAGPPGWAAPHPDELVDVAELLKLFRGKADPIRLATVNSVGKQILEGTGIAFDATNPFVAAVLEKTGSQITYVADTTRLNAMRIVRGAYEEGLTIPDTAKAIRVGMAAASAARATLIARTEMTALVNGASLAATKIVDQVLREGGGGGGGDGEGGGGGYHKVWMTAPGAHYPRHEDYPDLDGQTVPLDQPFDVGGVALQYPGDPDGPPEEVCNCRCTVSYVDGGGEEVGSSDSDGGGVIDAGEGGGGGGEGDGGGSVAGDVVANVAASESMPASKALVEDVTLGRADGGPEIRDALAAIDSVHRLPALDADPVPVRANNALHDSVGARLVSHREGSVTFADAIEVNPTGTRIELDFAHEIGHAIDYGLLRGDALKVVDAAKQTNAYKALERLAADRPERSEYLLRPREVFARAYAQWIAEKSANPAMLSQVADVVRGAAEHGLTPDQWTTADFAPIREALDRVFADRGLLEGAAPTPAVEEKAAAKAVGPSAPESFATAGDAAEWIKRQGYASNVGLGTLPAAGAREIADALAQSLGRYGGKLTSVELDPTRKKAIAYFRYMGHRDLGMIRLKRNVADQKSVEKSAAKTRDAFASHRQRTIEAKQRAIADEGRPAYLREKAQADLELAEATTSWATWSTSERPTFSIICHEAAHAIDHQKGLGPAWNSALRKYEVTRLDRFAVSEYGASSASELFAEAFALRAEGRPLPSRIAQALEEVLPSGI